MAASKRRNNKVVLIAIFFGVLLLGLGLIELKDKTRKNRIEKENELISKRNMATIQVTPIPSGTPTVAVTLTPSPKPMTFGEMNKLYGPCTTVPVLMYHHIENMEEAKKFNRSGLAVAPEMFRKQMEYLKGKGYNFIFPSELTEFLNSGKALPAKAVMITLDDAYEDNYTNAFPVLKDFGIKATIFAPTGLLMNPDYLTWDQMKEMQNSGLVYFGNHTWSHHSSSGTLEVQDKEISLADTQLSEHGQNGNKIFAYPYGKPSKDAESILAKYKYEVAFTTTHGSIMCKGQRYTLPRIRIGNAEMSRFGL